MELIMRQNKTSPDMIEILQKYNRKLILFAVAHSDIVYKTKFEERIKEGEEITFVLTEK